MSDITAWVILFLGLIIWAVGLLSLDERFIDGMVLGAFLFALGLGGLIL